MKRRHDFPRVPLAPGPLRAHREGGIIVLVLIVVLAVGLMGVALLNLGEVNGIEVVRNKQAVQAFWIAEGGLRDTIAQLRADQGVLRSPPVYSNSMAAGLYRVSVSVDGADYVLTSQARVQDACRTLQQTVRLSTNSWLNPGAAMISGGYVKFPLSPNTASIDGDVVACADATVPAPTTLTGDLIVDGSVTVNGVVKDGTVQVTAGHTVYGFGTYTRGPDPSAVPAPTDWSGARATFESMIQCARTNGSATVPTFPFNLNGQVHYFNVSKIANTTTKALIGPGTLVNSGDIQLFLVEGDVTVISGDLLQFATYGTGPMPTISNSTFYATTQVFLDYQYLAFDRCSLYSGNTIKAKTFNMTDDNSVLLAVNAITFVQAGTGVFNMQGRVESGTGIDMTDAVEFNLRGSSLIPGPPTGAGAQSFSVSSVRWADLGSAGF